MKSPIWKTIALYTLGAFSGVAISIGAQSFAANPKNTATNESLPIESLRTMAEVYGQIKANYVDNQTDAKLLENAVKGMVSGLDPHSEYMDRKDFQDMRESTSGEFGGLGMEIGSEDGFVKVIAPIEDTPAERAGVKSGDFIVKIDGESTHGMSVNDAVKRMRGKPGTSITLTLSRKDANKPIVITLTRATIKVRSVRHHLLENGYGYVRISQFQERTVPALAEAIAALTKENAAPLKGLVLDLRDDPGGLLNGAVGVSAAFLPRDVTVVSTKGRSDNREAMTLKSRPEDYLLTSGADPLAALPAEIKNIPLTVLINSGSASASEIVAGALQDHKRAVIVGTRSFGKGSVQSIIPVSTGGAIKLTTALYYTPNDRSIQATGIVPDVEVLDKNRVFESREADLNGHIGNPLGADDVKGGVVQAASEAAPATTKHESEEKPKDEDLSSRRKPNPEKDAQLRKALDLLKAPDQWKSSLGLAASKPAPAKNNGSRNSNK